MPKTPEARASAATKRSITSRSVGSEALEVSSSEQRCQILFPATRRFLTESSCDDDQKVNKAPRARLSLQRSRIRQQYPEVFLVAFFIQDKRTESNRMQDPLNFVEEKCLGLFKYCEIVKV